MSSLEIPNHLTGHLLIAMPGLPDPNFSGTVTLVCDHSEQGAMGLIINHPTQITMGEIFDQMEVEGSDEQREQVVLSGGPVSLERGFILHRHGDGEWESSIQVSADITLTASRDIILAMAGENPPAPTLMLLGYAGWEAGQLEEEMRENNSWLTTPATPELVFDTPFNDRLRLAVQSAGVDFGRLSGGSGRA